MTTSNILIISALALCSLQADVIELTHGDLLSGTIDAMSRESVTITSELSPESLEIESANIRNIIFDNLEAASQQHVELITLDNLRIKFTLNWKNMPNFVFRFCAENNNSTTEQNAYEFSFNSAGIQLNRRLNSRATSALTSIDLNPYDILNHELNVDIRVNRKIGKITLLLDGVERGSWMDPLDTANGNYILLNNRASQGLGCYIGNLSISEWGEGSRQKFESKLIQKKKDILIDTEDEVYQGHITAISKATPNKRTVGFEVEHAIAPLKVPDRRISALIFAKLNDEDTQSDLHYTAQLVGGGIIQLGKPKLTEGKISFTHPILGTCTIDTTMIIRIITQKTSP